jgi:peptidoglycan/xylan/chitin deacetylase (PgdA/CDA1 family)
VKLGLKVDVDTLRGTREGVPALLRLLDRNRIRATFLFSLGPDHTGRAIRRALRPGFLSKVSRTSVVSHYGVRTLMYGTLLPGPDIGRHCSAIMRSVRDAGHEVGIHSWDHVEWQDKVAGANRGWTESQMELARARFEEVFGAAAQTHGAAGWQMNAAAFEFIETAGFDYSSDTRGEGPFLPVADGRVINCPQLPTTLPTLDELLGRDGIHERTVVDSLMALTVEPKSGAPVFTLHAELEGMKLEPVFARLLEGWRSQGYEAGPLRKIFEDLDAGQLPRHVVHEGEIAGRSGKLAVQGQRTH